MKNWKKYLPVSDRILDYGCGTGTLALRFAGRVKEIHGIDFASGMIEAAKRKAAESRVDNTHFMQATIFDERLEKGSYDAALAWDWDFTPRPGVFSYTIYY